MFWLFNFASLSFTVPLRQLLRLTLPCGKFNLTYLESKEALFISAEKDTMAEGQAEIFSFGSGDFVKQSEAVDVAWSQQYMTSAITLLTLVGRWEKVFPRSFQLILRFFPQFGLVRFSL